MPLPAALDAQVVRLRATFREATILLGPQLLDDVRVHIDTLAGHVARTQALQDAYERVLEQAVAIFAATNTPEAITNMQDFEALKSGAATALDALEAALLGSRPTAAATALGFDW